MLKNLSAGFSAGLLIAIGGSVFLACENRYVGAVLFSVALLSICCKGFLLFTGKVGYIVESHRGSDVAALLLGLLGNLIATAAFGLLIRYAIPAQGAVAETLCSAKLTQSLPQTFIRAFFCGILMYLAVSIYKEKNTYFGIFFCVPVFILSGFEHSIADMFYFGAANMYTLQSALFLLTVVLGNSLGGTALPLLSKIGVSKNEKKD